MQLPRCEKCRSRYIVQLEKQRLWCQVCGNIRTDAEAQAMIRDYQASGGTEIYVPDFVPTVSRNSVDDVEMGYLNGAWAAMYKKDFKTARFLCNEALSKNPLLIDALLLLAQMEASRDQKNQYLLSILAIDQIHERANYELARLRGVIPANVPFRPGMVTAVETTTKDPVAAEGRVEQCPMCGGQTLYVAETQVKCRACGYEPGKAAMAGTLQTPPLPQAMPPDGNYRSLQDALMQRKYGINKEWHIAERVLACQNCGSQLTLSGNLLTQQCTFCDSQHILIRDAVGSFQEPDGVLPASIEQAQVEQLAYQAVATEIRGRVVQTEIVGVYLPYWCFQGLVSLQTPENGSYTIQVKDVLVAGTSEPSERILADLQPYHLEALHPYDQRFLARWSANLYTEDAIQASVTANAFAKYYAANQVRHIQQIEAAPFARKDKNYNAYSGMIGGQDFTEINLVGMLEYRLLLLPAWMITLYLEGKGHYHGIVNAQSGEVIFTERVDSKSAYTTRQEQPKHDSVIKPLTRKPASVIRPLTPRR